MRSTLRRLIPDAAPVSNRERLRAAAGAFVGISLTGLLGSLAFRLDPTLPAMIAPMGASAVLLFAVPSSPLAQPWSILCGNIVSAFVGVTVALLVPDIFLASALAISLAIAAMMALRCLHPPSGAVALTAVLGGPAVHSLGYGFILWPVAGNSLILLILALVCNNATGRAYPHGLRLGKASHGTADPTPIQKIGFSSADLDEVLKEYDEVLDIDRDVLEMILRKTELRSWRRRALHLDCASVMSRDVVGVAPDDSLRHAHSLMRNHHFKALPVTNDRAEIVGIVTQTDFLEKASWRNGRPSIGFLQRLRLILSGESAPNDTVKDIMTSPVRTVQPETAIEEAIIRFAEEGLHYLPVIDANGKMVGILSQSDVMVAMLADKAAA
ncbi:MULTISPECIES: HPP family protein [Agrobacterium]|uniref:CBS domain-containing protein n=1 Tax=Agrobacterium TaxID=357 RepID=UPI000DD354D5|nr:MULTISPECIES: HPP family protein [Agrobacterium]MBO9108504.1 HPP family protein [Agrobacterium sp. S2/73]NTA15720.1 HPP family protein [Agrobacterium tumefaciens]NTA80800.1 HPP family protein [Agrobacterium tumefaciens]QXZ73721.1 HPP family protein [Agrobacterium sp. S7/73]WCK71953.1 HPP family protein [Agrobacterium tumefaciens]